MAAALVGGGANETILSKVSDLRDISQHDGGALSPTDHEVAGYGLSCRWLARRCLGSGTDPLALGFGYLLWAEAAHTTRSVGALPDSLRADPLRVVQPSIDGELAAAIRYWAGEYGVSVALMDWLAQCESSYGTNPNAFNGVSGHATAFQFNVGTWAGTPPGQRGVDPWQATHWQSAEATAWMISVGRLGEWPTARGC